MTLDFVGLLASSHLAWSCGSILLSRGTGGLTVSRCFLVPAWSGGFVYGLGQDRTMISYSSGLI
jgi:hypothetical protein